MLFLSHIQIEQKKSVIFSKSVVEICTWVMSLFLLHREPLMFWISLWFGRMWPYHSLVFRCIFPDFCWQTTITLGISTLKFLKFFTVGIIALEIICRKLSRDECIIESLLLCLHAQQDNAGQYCAVRLLWYCVETVRLREQHGKITLTLGISLDRFWGFGLMWGFCYYF